MDATIDPVPLSPSKKLMLDDDTTENKLGDKALVSELDTQNKLGDETLDSESDTDSKLDDNPVDSESDTDSKLDDNPVDSESDTESNLDEPDTESKLDDEGHGSDSDTVSARFNDTDSDGCDGNCWATGSDEHSFNIEWSKEAYLSESDFECWCNYSRQIHMSGGFDLDSDYWGPLLSGITKVTLDDVCNSTVDPVKTFKTRFGELCVEALAKYNERNRKSLEFVRVEKGNEQLVRGYLYFVTFWAKDKDNGVERAFRAKLYEWRRRFRIMSCRPKPELKPCPIYYPLVRQS